MFANSYQSGFISIFYSVGSNPLALWDKQVKNGHIRRIIDDEVKSLVLEISGTNVATTYITCPIKPRASLGIRLPFFVMIIKNMKKYFTFEIQILDDKDMHRRFRVSNFQSSTKVRPFCTTMPIGLSSGWNQVQFNLADFTKRAYGSTYMETMRVQVHANVRIRRLYFTDTLYTDEELPNEFKLFGPMSQKKKEEKKASKEQLKEEPKPPEEVPPPPSPVDTTVGIEEVEIKDVHPADEIPAELLAELGAEGGEPATGEVTEAEGELPPEGEEPSEGEFVEGGAELGGGAPEGEEAPAGEGDVTEGAEAAPEGETPEGDAAPAAEGGETAPAEGDEPASEASPEAAQPETPAEGEPPAEAPPEEAPADAENPPA